MSATLPIRTLVVDDSPSSLRATTETLRTAGFDVLTATEGEEAIAMVNEHQPQVVVLDIILPKKTGFQVCREIKMNSTTRHIQVVLLSSKSQEADRFWGQRQGADAYLTKPVDAAQLVEMVRTVNENGKHVDTAEACATGPSPLRS